ncbi:oligosaccharide biosynthesis protein Alg14-like protein [Papiliotrema laurentii]|uniref:UDP-N-acetylglucosamine transferase subunit ALG14 n=1 Tax=Papiliotrema laurentii TaxID=5418 RepID=A0AAD9CUB0_PAPLA|nr:oligosaccharide biosynthesis protein Alg14-like protein [Papiliotrema laurentii]
MDGGIEAGGADSQNWDILLLPRARRVGQPLLSTCLSTAHTLLAAVHHLFLLPLVHAPSSPYCDVLLVNGPGTCVVVVLVSWIRRVLGLSHSRIIYVESWARVKSLSLSAKLLRPFVDSFVVQWPEAAGGGRAEYHGWLV